MKHTLERLLAGEDLSAEEARALLVSLTSDDLDPVVIAGLLVALRAKAETAEEILGMARGMRDAATPVPIEAGRPWVDTCGTGGDGSGSFNVSTATSLLVAACGVPVVKHGNRSVSSKCGSADVLDALGIPLAISPEMAAEQLAANDYTFLFAPGFHPAMKAVMPVRRALKVRTVFNLLGPLSNPARPPFQLLGAFREDVAEKMAHALAGLGLKKAFVVHGAPSWDEATPCGPFVKFDVLPGSVTRHVVDPEVVYGTPRCDPDALAGGDSPHNAGLMRALFDGERGAIRDAVLINTALVLELVGHAPTPAAAFAAAGAAIDDGRASAFLARVAG